MANPSPYAERMTDTAPIYDRLADRAREIYSSGKSLPIVIVDIDDTLFDRRPRWMKILADLLTDESGDTPLTDEHRALIAKIKPRTMTRDLEASLRATGLADENVLSWLVERVNTLAGQDRYLMFDLPTPGATEFIKGLSTAGSMTVYLGGERLKDEATFGTERAISMFELPAPRGEVGALFMRDRTDQTEMEFKRELVGPIAEAGTVIAVFENEPEAANLMNDAFPEAEVVLLDSLREADTPLAEGVQVISSFVRATDEA